jgi:hypothetical protein
VKNRFEISDRLTEIRLERVGTSILAQFSGAEIDPIESQYVFSEIIAGVKRYLRTEPSRGKKKSLAEIKRQKPQLRSRPFGLKQTMKVPLQSGLLKVLNDRKRRGFGS